FACYDYGDLWEDRLWRWGCDDRFVVPLLCAGIVVLIFLGAEGAYAWAGTVLGGLLEAFGL
ncbi:hypothetical protein RA269_28875, partial [Pseudomonas syringae pv. tagetis]|uniref:hypothetical protein n=1 Tax=Pseudomonas syringae group genomosp. 7 TaxID=251699 RepID=UPI003770378C